MSSEENSNNILDELNRVIGNITGGGFGEITDDTVWDVSSAEMPRDFRQEPLNSDQQELNSEQRESEPLTEREISRLNDSKNKCSVCYMSKSDKETIVSECNHVYCRDCFFTWLKQNTTCALCRHDFCDWREYSDDELEPMLNDLQIRYKKKRRIYRNCIKSIDKLDKEKEKIEKLNKILMARQIRLNQQFQYTLGYQEAYKSRKKQKICIPEIGSYKEGFLCGLKDFCDKVEKESPTVVLVKNSKFYKNNKKVFIRKRNDFPDTTDTESEGSMESEGIFVFRGVQSASI